MEILALIGMAYVVFLLALPFLLWVLWQRLQRLEARLSGLERHGQAGQASATTPAVAPVSAPETVAPPVAATPVTPPLATVEPAPMASPVEAERPTADEAEAPAVTPPAGPQRLPSPADTAPAPWRGWPGQIKAWAMGGNMVARVGILVLFCGVAFLLKYAADRGILPIQLRLAGAALGGIGLLATGWRLRLRLQSYGLLLQGGGIGIIYLTVFSAVTLYHLLSASAGQGLLIVLVGLSSALAVLQNAQSLAVLGATGGFLAPVLIASGGSHVWLFAYYAILDAGILAIAWFKAWRQLNLLGFAFTFGIGALWGYQDYQPAYFASTEPFLILFFLFYVAVAVLFAQRQPSEQQRYVDGTLVFGLPVVAFGLQSALLRDTEYGLAISALVAGFVYGLLAIGLWRLRAAALRMLTESFLALAVVFGTLAIPLAVDHRWTGAAWALEGAALVWVGIRQGRLLTRLFGQLVQLAAGFALLMALDRPTADMAVLNSLYLSGLMVSLSGLLSAFFLYQERQSLASRPLEKHTAAIMLGWGLFWWIMNGLQEIERHIATDVGLTVVLGFVALSCAAMAWAAQRWDWHHLRYPPLGLSPVMLMIALVLLLNRTQAPPLAWWEMAIWLLAVAVQYGLLRTFENDRWPAMLRLQHLATLGVTVFLLTWQSSGILWYWIPAAPVWGFSVWGLLPTVTCLGLVVLTARLPWPLQRFQADYLGAGRDLLVAAIALWVLLAGSRAGIPQPLVYVPILNPLELVQCLALLAMLQWWQTVRPAPLKRLSGYALAFVMFMVLNGIVARSTHVWAGVPFTWATLQESAAFQTALAITWTMAALGLMLAATRGQRRDPWFIGAVLLGLVVLKLFIVDLAGVETVARIVSFLVVGGLILLIGYLSPLPPRADAEVNR